MDDRSPQPDVRLIPLGQPIEGGDAIFEGSSAEARQILRAMSAEARAEIAVWTLGHVFTPQEFEAEQPGHEHDPLPHADG